MRTAAYHQHRTVLNIEHIRSDSIWNVFCLHHTTPSCYSRNSLFCCALLSHFIHSWLPQVLLVTLNVRMFIVHFYDTMPIFDCQKNIMVRLLFVSIQKHFYLWIFGQLIEIGLSAFITSAASSIQNRFGRELFVGTFYAVIFRWFRKFIFGIHKSFTSTTQFGNLLN